MGLFSFLIKSVIVVQVFKWLLRSIQGKRHGPWHVQYKLPDSNNPTKKRFHNHDAPKVIFRPSPNHPGINLLDGLVIDTPILKFNADSTSATSDTQKNPALYVAPPKSLPNGRVAFEVELPGFSKQDVSLRFNEHDSAIHVKGFRAGDETSGLAEKSVEYKLPLPDAKSIDVADIRATLANGLLVLDMGKVSTEGRSIQIE